MPSNTVSVSDVSRNLIWILDRIANTINRFKRGASYSPYAGSSFGA
jgi:hypothetical protein